LPLHVNTKKIQLVSAGAMDELTELALSFEWSLVVMTWLKEPVTIGLCAKPFLRTLLFNHIIGGIWWHSYLKYCATSQKLRGSISNGVSFHWHNPSGCTMALGSTQPQMEMGTRNIFWRGG
jgi:hypothetical protein